MEQKVLYIKSGREKIVSKPWDFEAMCIVDDAKRTGAGTIRAGMAAVYYLFSGTKATGDVIDGLPDAKKAELAMRVYAWYTDDTAKALKNL